jgi:phosphonate transport system permease protein
MGAAAGATGIGYDLFMASYRFMNIRETGYITWLILLVAIILEIVATRLKAHQRVQR